MTIDTSDAPPKRDVVYGFGVFRLDRANQLLVRNGAPIALTPKVFETLVILVERAGELVSKEDFIRRLWPDTFVADAALAENISRLRRALADTGDPPLILTVPKRGYRFAAPVTVIGPVGEPSAAAHPETDRRSFTNWPRALAALLGAAIVIGSVVGTMRWYGASAPPIRSIAVLPFEDLAHDPEQAYFADGITEELITDLAKFGALRVISRTSVARFKGARVPLPEIAQALNVEALVEGTVLRSDSRVRVTAHVVLVNPEKEVWAEAYDRPIADAMTLQAEIAREIARSVHVSVTAAEGQRLADARIVAPSAYEAFLKGRHYWSQRTEGATEKAVAQFQQAVQIDPSYALAYSGLADSYISQALSEALQETKTPRDAFPLARDAVQHALALDSRLGEAHASLGHIHFQYDRDWSASEREFLRAIELTPNYANAHHWYALSLVWQRRTNDALVEIDRARDLDPLSLVINANRSFLLACAGRFDAAIEQAKKTIDLDEHFAYGHYRLGQVYLLADRPADAVPEIERAIALAGRPPRAVAELGAVWARLGKQNEAGRVLAELATMSLRRYVPPFDLALVHAALGHRDDAVDRLERAYAERSPSLSILQVHPAFQSLQADLRFRDLVRRVGLPIGRD
jgi:TolB-like protein/DNA-binding winged helix-turn-helix (wHTH) protein/Tfp pilus assembly protein PilF